jgi:hypothetical protein
MWDGVKVALVIAACVVGVAVLAAGVDIGWTKVVEPVLISGHAQNQAHSYNAVRAANLQSENAIAQYQGDSAAGDVGHMETDRTMACNAANQINPGERYADVQQFYLAHCGPGQQ